MNEPRLQDIADYNSLEGEKRRVVVAVVLAGILMGIIYTIASNIYNGPEDTIKVEETFKHIPMR
jgi:hypothetical protein